LHKTPHLDHEKALWVNGAIWVAGIDEAGRGALAGPVVAAAVILPNNPNIDSKLEGVRDSKQMTPKQRMIWKNIIIRNAVTYGIGFSSAKEIDDLGIVPATKKAASRAIDSLAIFPDSLLLDYLFLPQYQITQIALTKGDESSLSIASASVLAKTTRDTILIDYDKQFPGYGFSQHKGYGTKNHIKQLQQLGPCSVHRFSYAPVKHSLGGM
jgi:ribonuclease HII